MVRNDENIRASEHPLFFERGEDEGKVGVAVLEGCDGFVRA